MHLETSGCSADHPFRLLAVIVLYKTEARNSVSFLSLEAARKHCSPNDLDLRILLYDNTPEGNKPGDLPCEVLYEHALRNGGLAGAYNRALKIALAEGFEWLLTLDQDTQLPLGFLTRLTEVGRSFAHDSTVAAIAPQLSDHGRRLSPVRIRFARVAQFPLGFVGFSDSETHAYNSGSMLRVNTLEQLGGFNEFFWLDFLDAWLYTQFNLLGKRVFVAGDLQLEHQLSLLDSREGMGLDRFKNWLQAESAFFDLYRGRLEGLALTIRLFLRLLRYLKRGVDPARNGAILACLKKRILHSKTRRLKDWERDMEALGDLRRTG
jgi:GT2 family glycosyltransferase